MKVLYISYDGMTDPLGQSQVIPYLQGLVDEGCEIHLLSCEKPDNFHLYHIDIKTLLEASAITWHPILYTKSPPVLSTIWDVIKLKMKASKLHKKEKFQLVHCRSYIAAIVGQYLSRNTNLKFVFDIRGFWADERLDGGIWSLRNPIHKQVYKFFKRKEKQFFSAADAVITLTNASRGYILNHFKTKGKITVIPCAADLDLFKPQKVDVRNEYRKKIGVKDNYVLLYLGSVGTWYLLNEMLDFFLVLKTREPNAKFVFISGESPNSIISSASKKGILEEDIIIQKSPRDEVARWLSIADLSVFFIKECFSKMASSPTKHGELLGANVPLVCNDIGDLKEIVGYRGSGTIVSSFEDTSYNESLDQINSINNLEGSQETASEFYSLDKGVKKYFKVYQSLL